MPPEWETGLDSTKTDLGMFQNKGAEPLSHSGAVYKEEAELSWKLASHENQLIPSPFGSFLHLSSCSRLFLSPPRKFSLPQASVGMTRSHLRDLMPLYWLLSESHLQNPGRQKSIGLFGFMSGPISQARGFVESRTIPPPGMAGDG